MLPRYLSDITAKERALWGIDRQQLRGAYRSESGLVSQGTTVPKVSKAIAFTPAGPPDVGKPRPLGAAPAAAPPAKGGVRGSTRGRAFGPVGGRRKVLSKTFIASSGRKPVQFGDS
jgi:hypothetical protein